MAEGLGERGENTTFKAMCSERWQSEQEWEPKCIMRDLTGLAVLLLFASSFSRLLWSVLACLAGGIWWIWLQPSWLGERISATRTDGYLTDTSVLCEWRGPTLTRIISLKLLQPWAELVLKSGLVGNLSMDNNPCDKRGFYHASLHFDHGNVLHCQRGLDQANWDGSLSVLRLLYVSDDKCQKCLCAFWLEHQ